MNSKIEEMRLKLVNGLDEPRYQHTLGVMYTAASMAMCHGENVENALVAGLLHDCAKCISSIDKIKLCEENGIEISETEAKNTGLLHAKLGAFLAEKEYGVTDEDILMSIRSHTTGRPGMSLLEKIIYIADYMEPGRKELPNMADVRKLELVNKRMLVADGVFGMSDAILGGFTEDLKKTVKELQVRTQAQIQTEHEETLKYYEEENRRDVESAEQVLFTTFTKELAKKVKIKSTPNCVQKLISTNVPSKV